MKRVWLLNFDADEELAGHQAPRSGARALQGKLSVAVADLVRQDALFDPAQRYPADTRGFAFMPTPRALAKLGEAGVRAPLAPPLAVLRQANDRALSARLGVALDGATFVTTEDDAHRVLASASVSGTWVLKRALGFAGRGAKRTEAGPPSDDVRAFIRNGLRQGGIEIAPWVRRLADFGLHGYLYADGQVEQGSPTLQHCDRLGQWERSTRAGAEDISSEEREALHIALREAAAALHAVGYFGPFGIDAFRYELPDGTIRFCPRCEINARYTMGWAIGMGDARPDLSE